MVTLICPDLTATDLTKADLIMINLAGADLNITIQTLPIKGGQPCPVAVALTDFGIPTTGADPYSHRPKVAKREIRIQTQG